MSTLETTTSYSKRNKRKPMQYFLNYVKHAENCQRGKVKDPIKDSYETDLCQFQFCKLVDQVISHKTLMDCKSGSSCNIAGCFSSTETFLHCKKCRDSDCFVCRLLKKVNKSVSTNKSITTSEECDKVEGAHFPGGLIINQVNPTSKSATKNWHSSVNSKERNKQISGFFRSIISSTDASVYLDRKLFNFLRYAAIFENAIYEALDSKEEYTTCLSVFIEETAKEFRNYREEQEFLTVKSAAEQFFRTKLVEVILKLRSLSLEALPEQESQKELTNQLAAGGSCAVPSNGKIEVANKGTSLVSGIKAETIKLLLQSLKSQTTPEQNQLILQLSECTNEDDPLLKVPVELPNGLTYTIGKPKSLSEETAQPWQKTISICDREDVIFKMYEANFPDYDFPEGIISSLVNFTDWEEKFFNSSKSKASYFKVFNDYISTTRKGKSAEKKKEIRELAGLPSHASARKNSKKKSNQSDLSSSAKLLPSKNLDCENMVKISDNGALCYSHYLLLVYSVSYQLRKKSEQESVPESV